MANHLIPYVEFLGLPGCGKSFFSHKVAEALLADGYKIAEPSWELDHTTGKYFRAVKKMIMAFLYRIGHYKNVNKVKKIIRGCGLSKTDERRYERNILYKAYLLQKKHESLLFFDEGIAQISVSMAVNCDIPILKLYQDLCAAMMMPQGGLLIKIECRIEDALLNMDMRKTNDSYVEKLHNLESKRAYLKRYEKECDTLSSSCSVFITSGHNDSEIITEIINSIKG